MKVQDTNPKGRQLEPNNKLRHCFGKMPELYNHNISKNKLRNEETCNKALFWKDAQIL